MSPSEYEALVEALIRGFTSERFAKQGIEVQGGRRNRISGISGYKHQIDVSVRTHALLLLVECKLQKRYAGVKDVLAHQSRIKDIRETHQDIDVQGSIVSTKRPTAGAWLLAKYYGIRLDTVKDANAYAIKIGDKVFAGMHAVVSSSASIEMKVIREADG